MQEILPRYPPLERRLNQIATTALDTAPDLLININNPALIAPVIIDLMRILTVSGRRWTLPCNVWVRGANLPPGLRAVVAVL